MHGIVGRRHVIVDNGVDDDVIVSREGGEATGLIIDAIGTMNASGAAGNGNGAEWEGGNVECPWRPKTNERRSALHPRTESDTATNTLLLSCSLASF